MAPGDHIRQMIDFCREFAAVAASVLPQPRAEKPRGLLTQLTPLMGEPEPCSYPSVIF